MVAGVRVPWLMAKRFNVPPHDVLSPGGEETTSLESLADALVKGCRRAVNASFPGVPVVLNDWPSRPPLKIVEGVATLLSL